MFYRAEIKALFRLGHFMNTVGIAVPAVLFLGILLISFKVCAFAEKMTPIQKVAVLESNCTAAESLIAADSLDQAEQLLKRNLGINRHHAKSLFMLGEIYRQRNSITWRRLSADRLKQAVIEEPNNDVYHFSLGLTFEKQGFLGNALNEFKKVVKLNPQHSEACRHIAKIYESIGLRYDDKELYMSSLEYSARAAAIDKNPNDYYEQAKMQIKMDLFDQALSKADTALALNPDSTLTKNLYLLIGLCDTRLGDFYAANIDFNKAKSLMNENELVDFEDVELVITPQAYSRLISMGSYEHKKEVARIWASLDPDLTTVYNERQLEHYARLIYADISFSLPEKGVMGKKSSRGETLIRFGFPIEKRYIYGNPLIHPPTGSSWEWDYIINGKEYTFRFEDTFHNGNFDYPFPGGPGALSDNTAYLADYLARTAAQKYDFTTEISPLNFAYNVRQFKGNHGNTDLDIFYNIPYRELNFRQQQDKGLADFEVRATLHALDLTLLDSATLERAASIPSMLINSPRLAVSDDFQLSAHIDSAYLSLAMTNPVNGHVGRAKLLLPLRKFYTDSVEISDMVLAREAQHLDSSSTTSRKTIKLVTNLDNRYFVTEPVVLYYEFYNLKKGNDDRIHYRIKQTISHLKKPKIIGQIIGYKVAEQVVTVYEDSNINTYENRLVTLDFSKFHAGRYRITIEIEDIVAGTSALASEELVLYE
jgi:GWxTD domain-containing protein